MSRTYKDRPHWVREIQDGHPIEHDHISGECIEETIDYVKYTNGGWSHHQHHYRNCSKRVEVTFYCTKKDPHVYGYSFYYQGRFRRKQECWTERCRCDVPAHKRHRYHSSTVGRTIIGLRYDQSEDCPTWGRVQCDGHTKIEHHDEIPCVCDDFPPRPTCTISYNSTPRGRKFSWTSSGVPSWFVTEVYHRPERHRSNTKLKDMAREYSYNGDIEDYDFENRQARNSARWLWW